MEKNSTVFDDRVRSALGRICPGQPVSAAELLSSTLAGSGIIARVRLGNAREPVLVAALVDRLIAESGLKVLVVVPGDHDVGRLKAVFDAVGIDLSCSTVGRDGAAGETDLAIGSMDAIATRAAAGSLDTSSFGVVALSDIDTMVDAASAVMLRRALGPAGPSRRLLAFSSEPGPAHRAMARELGGACFELELESGTELAKSVPCITYGVLANDKARLLLGLMKTAQAGPVVVFCNVRGTAEDASRRLRVAGLRVESILGNMPGKQALLESLLSGKIDVLVLTDDGAAGLPGSWATVLVNWDLPLEGEPYIARLAYIDQTKPGTRVVNFACERYSYGIPAIEQALGAPVPITKVEDSMMAPEPEPSMPSRTDRGSGYRNGDDRRDRGGQYDGRNIRSIQADIAAITGGAPQSASQQGVSPQSVNPKGGNLRGGNPQNGNQQRQTQPVGDAAKNSPRKDSRRRKGKKDRAPAPRGHANPEAKAAPGNRDARPQQAPESRERVKQGRPVKANQSGSKPVDPYSVSMEERLRMYRERYGSKSHAVNNSRPQNVRGSRPEQKKPATVQDRDVPREKPVDGIDSTDRPKGLVGALRDIFRKKDD
jgi:ATP-dependent RNA helicase RhlB